MFWYGKEFPTIQKVWSEKTKHNKALELAKNLAEKDISWKYGNYGGAPSGDAYTLKFVLLNHADIDSEIIHQESPTIQSGFTVGTPSVTANDKISPSNDDKDQNANAEDEEAPPKSFESRYLDETPFIAAGRNGILEIVKAILDFYPQAIEHVNIKNENIFHVVARNRRAEILDYLLSSPNVPISRLRKKIEVENFDTILHSAAYSSASPSRDRPGEALLLQSDLQ